MIRAQRLMRVFQIGLCQSECGDKVTIIANIEDGVTIHHILDRLKRHARGPQNLQAR